VEDRNLKRSIALCILGSIAKPQVQMYPRKFISFVLIVAVAAVVLIFPALAQVSTTPPSLAIQCQSFERQPNGMWKIIQPVTIVSQGATISLGPGAAFGPGVIFAGINLYELLERQCR
jgi:hypothetical protein